MRLEEVEWLLDKWWQDTMMLSSMSQIMAHPAAKRLQREQGVRLVPVLIEKLRTGQTGQAWGWLALLQKITRRKPFPAQYVGKVQELATSWADWYDSVK